MEGDEIIISHGLCHIHNSSSCQVPVNVAIRFIKHLYCILINTKRSTAQLGDGYPQILTNAVLRRGEFIYQCRSISAFICY